MESFRTSSTASRVCLEQQLCAAQSVDVAFQIRDSKFGKNCIPLAAEVDVPKSECEIHEVLGKVAGSMPRMSRQSDVLSRICSHSDTFLEAKSWQCIELGRVSSSEVNFLERSLLGEVSTEPRGGCG